MSGGNAGKPKGAGPLEIIVAGAIGGAVSYLYALVVPGSAETPTGWVVFLASIPLGALASGIGVYLLANSDLTARWRCIFFAVVCGLAYRAVIDAGITSVSKALEQQSEKKQVAAAEEIAQLSVEQVAADPDGTAQEIAGLVGALPEIGDPRARRTVRAGIRKGVESMKRAAERDPERARESVQALTKVGLAAARSIETGGVAELTVASLADIGRGPKADAETVSSAYDSLGQVAAAAEREGSLPLAMEARDAGARAVAEKLARTRGRERALALERMPVKAARQDLIAAQKFYESVGQDGKAASARQTEAELSAVARQPQ